MAESRDELPNGPLPTRHAAFGTNVSYDRLQVLSQVLIALGLVLTALGGYGAWHFGRKADAAAEAALTEKLNRLLPDARIIHLVSAQHLNAAGASVEPLTGGGFRVVFHELRLPLAAVIDHLATLEDLRELSLRGPLGNPKIVVDDVRPLARLRSLTSLDLGRTSVRDLRPLSALSELERLDIDSTFVEDLSPVCNLTKLWWLNAWGAPVSDLAPLRELRQLRVLWLGETRVTDLSPLYEMKHLRTLDLSGPLFSDAVSTATPVTEEQIQVLRSKLPELEIHEPYR